MATLYKKLAKKVKPKTKKIAEKPPEKIGNDYWLVAILALTLFFLVISWSDFDTINRALYVALVIALGTTYARRHYNFNEVQETWVERTGIIAMIVATMMFITKIYYKFIA